jgi:long-subunit acyl-CoA synthetase (AMP-forming)
VALDNLPRTAGPDDFDFDAAWKRVSPDDLLTIIYTSGTSGPPKGVEITHANLLAQADAITAVYDLHHGDIGLSYLPSAHIADRLASHYVQMLYAADITCVANLDDLGAALAQVRPTYWMSVPRVFEKMRVRIEESVQEASPVKRWLWQAARTFPHGIADQLVFAKVRARLGLDRARFVLSGAAPISVAVLEYFRDLGVPLAEIWGMSETCGVGTANPPGRVRPGTVGVPLPGVEVRLAEDNELLIRGPIVARGYRNDPRRTAESFDADGWLHTGDVARYDDQGYLKIVDRKKELIINAAGKNMSPSAIEGALIAACPLISSVIVVGDRRPYNVALIVLDPEAAEKVPDAEQALADGIAAGNDEVSRVEQVRRYAVVDGPWVPGGDELTPTLKLRRSAIHAKYAATIDALYND